MRLVLTIVFFLFAVAGRTQPVPAGTVMPATNTPVHDPVMIRQGNVYYLFSTGNGISIHTSTDLQNWTKQKPVFSSAPAWAVDAVPGFKGHIWAPDISFHNNKYHLFYSVSAFGKNTSCIGLATNETLDPKSANYRWTDHGKIIQSVPGRDMWNAIDPNLVIDQQNIPWLSFGSFWNGIKLVRLDSSLRSVSQPPEWYTIASRSRRAEFPDSSGGNAAIEAPFIFKKNDYYYLFVSWDYCCRGEKSNYKVMVGRSQKISGPYLDKNNVPLAGNGGSLFLQGDNQKWYGAGHNAIYSFNNQDYVVLHGYDAADKGKAKLILRSVQWDKDGWPTTIL